MLEPDEIEEGGWSPFDEQEETNGNGNTIFKSTPGIGLDESKEEFDGPLMLQGRGAADEVVEEEEEEEDMEEGSWSPFGNEEESIEDAVKARQAQRDKVEADKAADRAANASKYSQEELNEIRKQVKLGKWTGDGDVVNLYEGVSEEEGDAATAEKLKMIEVEQDKINTQTAEQEQYQKENIRSNMSVGDFQLGEDEAVAALNKKYEGKGVTFSVASDWGGKDKITVTGKNGVTKDFLLGSQWNVADSQFGNTKESIQKGIVDTYKAMNAFIDGNTQGPAVELTEEEEIMQGVGPVDESNSTLEEATVAYQKKVDAINASDLTPEEKWNKLSNLPKPTYSTLEMDKDGKYIFKPKNEYLNVVKNRIKAIKPEEIDDPNKLYTELEKVKEDLITSDPVLRQQAKAIQTQLAPTYKDLAETIRKEFNITPGEDDPVKLAAAEDEYQKRSSALFYEQLDNSMVYKRVVGDINNSFNQTADAVTHEWDRRHLGGASGASVNLGDALRKYKGLGSSVTGAVATLQEAMVLGFGGQTGKSWNASQISMAQLGIDDSQGLINDYDALATKANDDKKVYVYNNGAIDYEKSGLEQPMRIGATSGMNNQNVTRNLKGEVVQTHKQNVYGGEREGEWMTLGEAKDIQYKRQDEFKEAISGDLEELRVFEGILEQAPQADFSDGIGVNDIMATIGQVLPQMAISTGGALLAAPTGGASLVASSMFMAAQEYGNNYWDGVVTGLEEELGHPPSNEEIMDALAKDKYSEQGTAAGWAAVSAALELGTGGRGAAAIKDIGKGAKNIKNVSNVLNTVAKKSGFKGVKEMMVKTGKNQFVDILREAPRTLVKMGKGGIKEYMTEFSQEIAGQASTGVITDNDVLAKIDFESANEAGTGGGIVGFLLPGMGGMLRGGKTVIRQSARMAAVGINSKNSNLFAQSAASTKQTNKFFKDASASLKKMKDNGLLTQEEYQVEAENLANTRNAANKIPKGWSMEGRQEGLDLMQKKERLEGFVKDTEDVFSEGAKTELKNVNAELRALTSIENATSMAQKAVKGSGQNVEVVRAKNTKEANQQLKSLGFSKSKVRKIKASNKFGIHVSEDPETGKRTIILNEEKIRNKKQWTTAQHEVLHDVLRETLKGNNRNVFALENALAQKLGKLNLGNTEFARRVNQYQAKRRAGTLKPEVAAEEALTLFSEALATGDIKFEEGGLTKIQDMIRRLFQTIAPGSKLGKIKFKNEEDVYNFIKDYNKSIKKGKFTRAQKNLYSSGAEISADLGKSKKKIQSEEDLETVAPTGEAIVESPSILASIDEDIDDLVDEGAEAITIAQKFKGSLRKLANSMYSGNAKFNTMKDQLLDELIFDSAKGRGTTSLVNEYLKKKAEGKIPEGQTMGQFVMGNKAGMPQRIKDIAARVLGIAAEEDIDSVIKTKKDFSQDEKSSLRKDLEIFSQAELDLMLKEKQITQEEHTALQDKSKLYDKVIDGVKKIFGGKLPTVKSGKLIQTLEKEFADFFETQIKEMMGTASSTQYAEFLATYGDRIFDKLSQRTVNKKFPALKEPVLDKNGKQERILTDEALAEGSRVKDKYSGPLKFKKKDLKEGEFVEYHLDPKKARPSSKRNTLAQALAAELGFDAAQQVLKTTVDTDLETGIETTLADARKKVYGEDVVTSEIESLARDLGRGVEYKFSEELEYSDEIESFMKEGADRTWDFDKWQNEFSKLPPQVQQVMEEIGYTYAISEGVMGFRLPTLSLDWGPYNEYQEEYAATNLSKASGEGYQTSLDQMADSVDNLMDTMDPVFLKFIGKDFIGLRKGKASLGDLKGGKYEILLQKYNELTTDITAAEIQEFIKENGFDPRKISLLNANKRLFNSVQKINNLTINNKQERILEEYGDQIKDLNETNPKALAYFETKMLETLVDNANSLPGLLRLMESSTNNVNGVRGLTKFSSMVIIDGVSLAPFVDPDTGKYYSTKAEAGKNKDRLIINDKHPFIKEAKEGANTQYQRWLYSADMKGKVPTDVEASNKLETIMYQQLRYKGEHVVPSGLLNYEIAQKLMEYGAKIQKDSNNKDFLLDEFTNVVSKLSRGFDQELGPKVLSDIQDEAYGTTTKLGEWRTTILKDIENYFINPVTGKTKNQDRTENTQRAIDERKLSFSIDESINEDSEMLNDSRVLNISENTTMDEILDKAAKIDEALRKARKLDQPVKKIRVFDFDDTLARTNSKVIATRVEPSKHWDTREVTTEMYGSDRSGRAYKKGRDSEGKINKSRAEDIIYTARQRDQIALTLEDNTPLVREALETLGMTSKSDIRKARHTKDDALEGKLKRSLRKEPKFEEKTLTAEEFAEQGEQLTNEGWKMDFSDFNKVVGGKRGPLWKVAENINKARGNEDLYILTARAPGAANAIYEFLKSQGLEFKKENIVGLADSRGLAKANWMVDKAAEGYNDFYFADDAMANVSAVQEVMDVIDVKSKTQQAKIKFSEDLDKDFNNIIEQTTGLESWKAYSKARAEVKGANKGRFKFWIPPSAEDFVGLIYKTLSKGETGDIQMAWWKKNILDPYARAMGDLSSARLNLMNDFRKLKKTLQVPKELTKEAVRGFNNEQAVRVYLWNKNGKEIPGLSKRDVKDLVSTVENNPTLQEFANQLEKINKEAYPNPTPNWLVGTITSDLIEGLNTTKRDKYLEQWKQNAELVFSEKNLNKLESIYGPKYREALENILKRMKSGKNRLTSGNKLTNRVLDYINGSNAAIMFFNTRSAVLQTISAINFINWSFNNPYQAGKAFANQPQYWKDFVELMNSDYLKDRRNGLRLNITENEVAEAAKTAKNKAKGVLNYILKKGYLPTQYADSFAIASGGATFYRNKINQLLKEGKTEAEAKEMAMLEFRQISEESQQSSDPSRISSQQASSMGRLILMFANTPMQYARIQKRAFQDLVSGRGDAKTNVSKIVYYGFIQNMLFNGLQQALFALGMGDDEEEDVKKISNTVNGMLDSQLRGLGFGGAALSAAKNFLLNIYERSGRSRPQYKDAVWELLKVSPPISSKISKLRGAAYPFDSKERRQEVKDKGFDIDNPAYESLAKVVSATANIPLDRVLQKYNNIKAAMEEDTAWWQSVAMLAGWPSWAIKPDAEEVAKKKERKEKKKISDAKKKEKAAQEDIDAIEKAKREKGKGKDRDQYKNGRVPKAVRTDQENALYDLTKQEQEDSLVTLFPYTKAELRAMNEGDRVQEIIDRNKGRD